MNSQPDFPHDFSCEDCGVSPCDISRRAFLQLMAAGAGVALLGGCGGASTPEGSAPVAGSSASPIAASSVGKEWKIAGAGKLEKGAALAFVLPDQSRGIVFVTQNGKLGALSAKCTHAGGIVEWQGGDQLRCPNHGSKFDAAGKVLNGPAVAPLAVFKVRKQSDDVLISTV